jgi:lipid A 3-O-deacylase
LAAANCPGRGLTAEKAARFRQRRLAASARRLKGISLTVQKSMMIHSITMKRFRKTIPNCSLAVVLLLICFLPCPSLAGDEEASRSETLTVYLENDLLAFDDNDRYYTHGTKISWISRDISNYRDIVLAPSWIHRLIGRMPFVNDPGDRRTVSVSFGQNIYTPEDKERSDLILDDRPYAGITYLGLGLHSKSERQMNTLEFGIGIVGRHSYAEDIQKEVHIWTDSADPKGWSHQLHDEPILNLYFERKWKAFKTRGPDNPGFDFIPHMGIAVGNAYTGINMGGQVRFGWNLPNDFGTYLIRQGSDGSAPLDDADPRFLRPCQRFGIHLFLAVDGNAVARNILLDGNTFRDGYSVDKKPFVADVIGGIGIIVQRFKITYSYVYRTKEFETQKGEQEFGSISVSLTF